MSEEVVESQFWIIIGRELVHISARLDFSLAALYTSLHKDPHTTEYIPATVSYRNCDFYRLKNPVSMDCDDSQQEDVFLEHVMQACLERSNKSRVSALTTTVGQLANQIVEDHVYLVINFLDPLRESNAAIGRLRRDHRTLFNCLQVSVEKLGSWQTTDVTENLQGGILTDDILNLPSAFKDIQDALARPRVYRATDNVTNTRDFQNAHCYETQFNRVFTAGSAESQTVINNQEFAAFYHLLRVFYEDVSIVAKNTSSSLKASNFTVHFVQSPFLSGIHSDSRGFRYHQETSWGFPIFLNTKSTRDACWKLTPRSDWMVISPQYKIPFIISEVISVKREKTRSRMLVEAIALARVGHFLLKPTPKKKFFVVAIYVNANMVATRYIVMQTESHDAGDNDKPVSIHQTDFDLQAVDQGVDFLREMYNLTTQIAALADDLDQEKKGNLCGIHNAASKVLSLSSAKHRSLDSDIMDPITEENRGTQGPQDEDDLGVFEAMDIQNILYQMNYEIEFIPWGHPQLAVIVNKAGDKHGYLKFVEREREVKVLQYLTDIESSSNHTISGVQFWPVEGGTVISMPVAGSWLTSLNKPNEQLWSVALQLVEAVAFMHEHNVAHMDLKPQNVIIPDEGGRLSIIDFSVSILVRGPDVRYSGVVGTEDYIAPEVREGKYKPMVADLWSCGRTLEELCACCHPSADQTMLLEIAKQLMNRDPEARPRMSTILERMASFRRGEGNVVPAPLRSFPTVPLSPLRA